MEYFWYYLSAGFVLSLYSAVSPGPLITLLVSETLFRGPRAGLQIAIVPIFTDLPIIVLALAVRVQLDRVQPVLGVLSLLGAGFLVWLALQNFDSQGLTPATAIPGGAGPLRKGLLVNILNPHAYLFWFMVGAPLVLGSWARGPLPALAFLASFYLVLISFNIVLVLAVSRGRFFIQGRAMLWVLRALGVGLLVFAVLFVKQGLTSLGVL